MQNKINDLINNRLNDNCNEQDTSWFPNNLKTCNKNINVQVKLLCGADLLESFGVPGLWSAEDVSIKDRQNSFKRFNWTNMGK